MTVINIDLEHIEKGLNDINRYTKEYKHAIEDGISEILEKADQKCNSEIMRYGLENSNLATTKIINKRKLKIRLEFNSEYAKYIEYGTGIVGANNPYPIRTPIPWNYGSGKTVKENGSWFFFNVRTGLKGKTFGQPSRPIMYTTANHVRRYLVTRIIRKHIRGIKL